MELAGYFAAILIGISLGLVGAGGSILTVPLMIYLFRLPVLAATSYSLFIVGCTSLVGALNNPGNYKARRVSVVLLFCLTSATTVSLIRKFVMPRIPGEIFAISGIPFEFSALTTIVFALMMIFASRPLIAKTDYTTRKELKPGSPAYRLFLCAIVVGAVTGFLGAGGGFLIIPSLIFILGFEMKEAVSTSLLIIAINSIAGFASDFGNISIHWTLLGYTTIAAIGGVFAGRIIAKKTSSEKLRILFGWFILVMGWIILVKEVIVFLSLFFQQPIGITDTSISIRIFIRNLPNS